MSSRFDTQEDPPLEEGDVKVVKSADLEIITTKLNDSTHVAVYRGEEMLNEDTYFDRLCAQLRGKSRVRDQSNAAKAARKSSANG